MEDGCKHRSHEKQSDIVLFIVCKFITSGTKTCNVWEIHYSFLVPFHDFLPCMCHVHMQQINCNQNFFLIYNNPIIFWLYLLCLICSCFGKFYIACNKTLHTVNIKCLLVIIRKIQSQWVVKFQINILHDAIVHVNIIGLLCLFMDTSASASEDISWCLFFHGRFSFFMIDIL